MAETKSTFPTGTAARLRVRNPAGDVEIDTAETDETTVELLPLNDSDATRDAIANAKVYADGAEVVVEVESGRNWSVSIGKWGLGSAKVGVRITCPTGSELQCDAASADVRAEGTLGTARVRTASGDIRLRRIAGQLEAKTASGDITVEHVEGRAVINTVSGDLELRAAMNGLAVTSVSGDVGVGSVLGNLEVGTVSGDASVDAAGPGEVSMKAVSGDLDVAVRRGLRVRLDVNSVSGKIGSDLDVSDTPSRIEGPEASVRLRTVSGDVKISRAVEAVA